MHHTTHYITELQLSLRPDIKEQVHDGDVVVHLAKIGSDFATGHGKRHQRKTSKFDEDGSHNSGFQTVSVSSGDKTIFLNRTPGGSELLRLTSKTMEKDTKEKMVENMAAMDRINEEMEDQVTWLSIVYSLIHLHLSHPGGGSSRCGPGDNPSPLSELSAWRERTIGSCTEQGDHDHAFDDAYVATCR